MIFSMLQYLIPFFFFTLFTAFFVLLFKVRFGEALPLAICTPAFILYFSQYVLHTFFIGFCLLLLLAFIAVPLFLQARKKDAKETPILKNILSPGFIAFAVIYFFAVYLLQGKPYGDWDEMTHWGMMIKEALRLDDFYCIESSRVLWHKEYPPFNCMFEIFWAMLGGYSEGKMTIAMHVTTLSLVIPWLMEQISDHSPKAKWYHHLLISFSFDLMILSLEYFMDKWTPRVINTIIPDMLLAFLYAAAGLLIYTRSVKKKFFFITLCVITSMLPMVKQIGLAFYLLILFTYFAYEICEKHQFRKWICKGLILAAFPLLLLKTWNIRAAQVIAGSQFDLSKIEPAEYIATVQGKSSDLRNRTFRLFFEVLFQEPINTANYLPITFVSALILSLLLLYVLRRFFPTAMKRSDYCILSITNLLGSVGYTFMLSVLYLFCFTEGEMETLVCYFRYTASYLMSAFVLLFAIAAIAICKRHPCFFNYKRSLLCAAVSLAFLNPSNLFQFVPQCTTQNIYAEYKPYADYLSSKVEKNAVVYIIYDKSHTLNADWWGPMQYFVQYFADQVSIVADFEYCYSFAEDLSDPERRKAILEKIATCDYLYMVDTNDNINQYLSPYNQGQPFVNMGIYHVDLTDTGLHFTLIP